MCYWLALKQFDPLDVLRSLEPLMHRNGPNDRILIWDSASLIKKKWSTIAGPEHGRYQDKIPKYKYTCKNTKIHKYAGLAD